MIVLSAAQAREVDRVTIEDCGVPGAELMSNAAAAVTALIEKQYPSALAGRIGVLCGAGNNGGDGLLVARNLAQRQVEVSVLLLAPRESLRGDAAAALASFEKTGLVTEIARPEQWAALRDRFMQCGLIVDAIFGTGLQRPLTGLPQSIVQDLNNHFRGMVVAVDVPTGLSADASGATETTTATVLRAHATVTFTAPKRGHFLSLHADRVGRLNIAPIGTPPRVLEACDQGVRRIEPGNCLPYLAPRATDAHKGQFGHVMLAAGSRGKSGAAVLAATAALRMGAGLVTVATPCSVLPLVAAAQPELMTEAWPETEDGALDGSGLAQEARERFLAQATVVAIGPGLGQAAATAALVRDLVSEARQPCVLDADGLNAFAGRREKLRLRHGVLTPHPGEMGRLFGVGASDIQSRRLYYAQRLAAETGAVVVLKGHFSLIADPGGDVIINDSGNPGMATAGAGDVLTGFISGLVAQFPRLRLLDTVAAAVYLHGAAGDAAAERLGQMCIIAGDLITALPAAMQRVRKHDAESD